MSNKISRPVSHVVRFVTLVEITASVCVYIARADGVGKIGKSVLSYQSAVFF